MSSGSEEPVLFLRNENDPEGFNEDWDDSDLIAAYDKTVSTVKRQITRKIQRELGLKDEDISEYLSDAESSGSKSKKYGKEKKKRGRKQWAVGSSCRAIYSEDGKEYEAVVTKIVDSHWCIVRFVGYENEEEVMLEELIPSLGKHEIQRQIGAATKVEGEWAVGSFCRAIYSEDGKEYEAVVTKIVDSHWCIVRFVGYENEEEVMLEELIPSFGKHEIQRQIKAATKEEGELQDTSDEEYIEDVDEVPIARVRQGPSMKKIHRESEGHAKPLPKRLPMSFAVPPPPPVLPSTMSKEMSLRQNDIDALLMSWYMCGYYTGLYEKGQNLQKN